MSFEWDASDFLHRADLNEILVSEAVQNAMHEATDDLLRISSNVAPIDKEILRKSGKKIVKVQEKKVIGEVWYSAVEKSDKYGRFNYALWTHEMTYNLGEQSALASGTDGYAVGNKYLSRPLFGEESKYWKWVAEAIERSVE